MSAAFDPILTLHHLTETYGYAAPDQWFTVCGFGKNDRKVVRWCPARDLDTAVTIAQEINAEGMNVYLSMALVDDATRETIIRRAGRIRGAEAGAVIGAYVEIDLAGGHHAADNLPATDADILDILDTCGLPRPTLAIHSGGGIHAYWLFAEPYIIETPAERAMLAGLVKGVQAAIKRTMARRDWHLDPTADLARVLRLAGTVNYNSDPPTLARILWTDGPRVSLDDLEPFTLLEGENRPTPDPITEGAGLSPADRLTIAALIMPHWKPNSRHALALAVPGWLAKLNVPEADAHWIIQTIADNAGNQDRADEFRTCVRDTYRNARAGEHVAGWSKLARGDDPLIKDAATLDRLHRLMNPIGVTGGQLAAASETTQPCAERVTALEAEIVTLRRENERLQAFGQAWRAHAQTRLRLMIMARRQVKALSAIADNPYFQGRVAAVRAVANAYSHAGGQDQRHDGMRRVRRWKAAKQYNVSEDMITDTIKSLTAVDVLIKDNPQAPQPDDRNAPPRTELFIGVPGLDEPEGADPDTCELLIMEHIARATPRRKRLGKKGNTHGGFRPKCPHCGPDAIVEQTITRRWHCTSCQTTVAEDEPTVVSRYRNDGRPIPWVVSSPHGQVAAASDEADPWDATDVGTQGQVASQEPYKETWWQVASASQMEQAPPEPAAFKDIAPPLRVKVALEEYVGHRVRTPDGEGIFVRSDLSKGEDHRGWQVYGEVCVRVAGEERWYHPNRVTLIEEETSNAAD